MDREVLSMREIRLEAEIYKAVRDCTHEAYDGAYTVTPNAADQQLETRDKLMWDDITVLAIPYREVGNASGTTIIIGDV